jgi:aryl-phospho-beta-D-glucosidase BglC (GH1 family)
MKNQQVAKKRFLIGMKNILLSTFTFSFLTLSGCQKDEINSLSVNTNTLSIDKEGGSGTFTITTNADSWNITQTGSHWNTLSTTSGTYQTAMVSVLVSSKTIEKRTDTLTITAGNAKPVQVLVTQEASDYLYTLSASVSSITFSRAGNSSSFKLTSTAPQWTVESDVEWLTFDKTTGSASSVYISASASENEGTEARTATITLKADYAPTVEISVTQKGEYYPSYNTSPLEPDATGMSSTALELAAKMKVGWNLGNTLEAIGGETAWGNPVTSQAIIDLVNNSGFNAVRLPCSWNGHLSNASTAQINATWLERVRTVVQYCINNDMYVILNIHWDGGWLENNCTTAKQEVNNAKQKAFWEQIATYMRDFDEHLLFASANEPNVENATEMSVLNSYHQTFINAVRSTGGKNSYRVLVIQGPSTDIEKTNNLMVLPTDPIPNKMMAEVHYYSPYQFCLMDKDADWGKMAYYWGNAYHSATDTERNATWGEEAFVDEMFGLMKTQFVNQGIPVIMGEYAAVRRTTLTGDALTLHLNSRAYYLRYVTQQMKANGIIPFYWDAGGMGNLGSALINRNNLTVFDQQALDSIMVGAQ